MVFSSDIGEYARNPFQHLSDVDGDGLADLGFLSIDKPSTIAGATFMTLVNQGTVETATCVATSNPSNPDGCLFVERPAATTAYAAGLSLEISPNGFDVNGDAMDFAVAVQPNGGNSAGDVAIVYGFGDGTYDAPERVLTHNDGAWKFTCDESFVWIF